MKIETRSHVLGSARLRGLSLDEGYQPNASALALAEGKTRPTSNTFTHPNTQRHKERSYWFCLAAGLLPTAVENTEAVFAFTKSSVSWFHSTTVLTKNELEYCSEVASGTT